MAKLLAIVGLSAMLACSGTAATAAANNKAPSPTSRGPEQTYCFQVEASTGSHISTQECHTKSQWKELGVDVDEQLKKR